MSREIKFRAWDSDQKRMLKVSRISFDGPIEGAQAHCYRGLTLEQFTGLKDKNGKEIYEGDIVKVSDETGSSFVSAVKYFDYDDYPAFDLDPQYLPTNWYFEANILSTLKADGNEIKVVGNVHANPELLEAQHDTRTD